MPFSVGKCEQFTEYRFCHTQKSNRFNALHSASCTHSLSFHPYITYQQSGVCDACLEALRPRIVVQPQNNTYFQLFYVVIGVEMKKRLDTASTIWSTAKRRFGNNPMKPPVSAVSTVKRIGEVQWGLSEISR
jgi:hypothetical protein